MTIPELLQKRAALGEQARSVILAAQTEGRALKGEEIEKYDRIKADIDGLSDLINRERSLSSAMGEKHEVQDPKEKRDNGSEFKSRVAAGEIFGSAAVASRGG